MRAEGYHYGTYRAGSFCGATGFTTNQVHKTTPIYMILLIQMHSYMSGSITGERRDYKWEFQLLYSTNEQYYVEPPYFENKVWNFRHREYSDKVRRQNFYSISVGWEVSFVFTGSLNGYIFKMLQDMCILSRGDEASGSAYGTL